MQITSFLAAILLAAPALVSAAPVASNNGISAADTVFARDATCNPVFSTDKAVAAKQKESEKRMRELTVEYKAAEKKCPSDAITKFNKKGGDKNAKAALKQKCIDGYTECATKRDLANKACIAAGGKSDAGHKTAVKFCKDKAAEWKKRTVS